MTTPISLLIFLKFLILLYQYLFIQDFIEVSTDIKELTQLHYMAILVILQNT